MVKNFVLSAIPALLLNVRSQGSARMGIPELILNNPEIPKLKIIYLRLQPSINPFHSKIQNMFQLVMFVSTNYLRHGSDSTQRDATSSKTILQNMCDPSWSKSSCVTIRCFDSDYSSHMDRPCYSFASIFKEAETTGTGFVHNSKLIMRCMTYSYNKRFLTHLLFDVTFEALVGIVSPHSMKDRFFG